MRRSGWNAGAQSGGQQATHRLSCPQHHAEQTWPGQQIDETLAQRAFWQRPRHALVHEFASQVDQPPVLDAGRAGSLAGAAGEAPIEVVAGGFAGRPALDELLDQVDASARTVELVARHAIGGAGRQAEPAMDAVAEQRLRFIAACGSFEFAGGAGVHGYRSA